jgi:hypothetical protein
VALPAIACLYSPLLAAANTPGELIRLRDLVWPVSILLMVGATAFLLYLLIVRNPEKASLAAFLAILAYSWLGLAIASDREIDPILASVVVLGLVGIAYGVASTQRSLTSVIRLLVIMVVVLVLWNTVVIIHAFAVRGKLPVARVVPGFSGSLQEHAELPDIYLILLDKYSSSSVLASQYGFDNRSFARALQDRGFIVPTAPRANYTHTPLALGAMLNLRYLDELRRIGSVPDWEASYPLIENNRLAAFLRERGYRIVTFSTEFGGDRQNRYADLQLPAPKDVRPEIQAVWTHQTATPLVDRLWCHFRSCRLSVPPYLPASTDLMDWRFWALGSLPDSGGHPLFVFAHFFVPHEPYIYDARCHHIPSWWPADDSTNRAGVIQAYTAQIQCLNTKLLTTIDRILARSRNPIILLQGDHGHGMLGQDLPALGEASPAAVLDRTSVFAAYLLPGVPSDSVPPNISPINLTRLMLRRYFGAELPPLAEMTFWSSEAHPYVFTRVR